MRGVATSEGATALKRQRAPSRHASARVIPAIAAFAVGYHGGFEPVKLPATEDTLTTLAPSPGWPARKRAIIASMLPTARSTPSRNEYGSTERGPALFTRWRTGAQADSTPLKA